MSEQPSTMEPAEAVRRILVLSPCDVFPPVHGSSTAIYHTLQHLSEGNRVYAVLCALYSQRGEVDLRSSNLALRYCRESPLDRLGYKGLVFNPFYYHSVLQAARQFQPHIIQAELLWTAPAALWVRQRLAACGGPPTPVVLMQENVEYQKFVRFGLNNPFLRAIKWLEASACRAVDRIATLSEVDRDSMVDLYDVPLKRFALIPHGVDPDLFAYRADGGGAAREALGLSPGVPLLTFVGKLDYIPNTRAVTYIADLVAPAVRKRYPDAQFAIIGQGEDAFSAGSGSDGLIFTGFIDARAGIRPNLSDYLSASDVVLVPLDSGSGTRLKILEAASNARPVVSTRIGAEGQDFVDGEEILLTDTVDQDFVDATLRLLDDAGLRHRLGEAARSKVLARYSWQAQVRKMEEVYEELGV